MPRRQVLGRDHAELDEQVARAARTELCGRPRPRRRSWSPLCVAFRTFTSTFPSSVGAPSRPRARRQSRPASARHEVVPDSDRQRGSSATSVDARIRRARGRPPTRARAPRRARADALRPPRRGRFTIFNRRAPALAFSRPCADPPTTSPERAPSAPRLLDLPQGDAHGGLDIPRAAVIDIPPSPEEVAEQVLEVHLLAAAGAAGLWNPPAARQTCPPPPPPPPFSMLSEGRAPPGRTSASAPGP